MPGKIWEEISRTSQRNSLQNLIDKQFQHYSSKFSEYEDRVGEREGVET